MGWLMWNVMRLAAVVGVAIIVGTFVLFLSFMFEVGFAWAAIVVIGLVLLLVAFAVKNRGTGFDIRR